MSITLEPLRIWRSPYSNFYKDETLDAAKVYTSDYLRELADAGFNAIWIRAILREIVPSRVFPEFGRRSADYLRSLRAVIRRGERMGVRVFLYMQEPRGFLADARFWRRHPEAEGATYRYWGNDVSAMCTSEPSVRAFLREGAATLSRKLPGLGGAILITASEHVSHCYSHYGNTYAPTEMAKMPPAALGCSRCERRRPADIIADIVGGIHSGFRDAKNGAEVIAWNWSWRIYEPNPQEGILRALPRGVRVMGGFERGGAKRILGRNRVIDEYAISFAGPSDQFVQTLRAARKRGLKVMAKLQIGVTHELATVPNLPLIGTLYDKARAMRSLTLRDFMGCWAFGNMLTANSAAFLRFMTVKRLPPRDRALEAFAASYFPGCDAKRVKAAWELFAMAMDSYPFCIPFLYYGPTNYALAHPIDPGPIREGLVGRSWLPDRRRGDDLRQSLGPYTLTEVIRGLGKLTRIWRAGVEEFERGAAGCDAPSARDELNTVRMVGHCFHSCWNLYRAYRLRRNWKVSHRKSLLAILRDERKHLAEALPIVVADKRMGFHSEAQRYLCTATGIRRKLKRINALLGS